MRYPVAVEPDTATTACGIVMPDLPGCFSAGDTLDEAIVNAGEAIAAWIEATLDQGGTIPAPSSLERLRHDPAYAGWVLAVVFVDGVGAADLAVGHGPQM